MRGPLFVLAVLLHLAACAWPARPRWALLPGPLLAAAAIASSGGLAAHKALAMLVMPAGLVWLALLGLASAALLERPQRRGRLAAALALFFGFWAMAAQPAANLASAWLERGYERAALPDEPLDALLLLGGGASESAAGKPELTASGDRLVTAAAVVHQGGARAIVYSGSDWADPGHPDRLGADTAALLEGMGIARAQLVALPGPRTTSEEIAAAAALLSERGWRRFGIVTSAWHMRRALRLARRQGLDPVPVPADHHGGRVVVSEVLDVLPSAPAFAKLHAAAWEIVGASLGR